MKGSYKYARQWLLGEGVVNFRRKGIVNLIDVGSAGELPYPWNKNARKIQHLLKFEPRDKPSGSPYIVTVDAALWETNCELEFYIYKGLGGSRSSLFQQNYEYVAENKVSSGELPGASSRAFCAALVQGIKLLPEVAQYLEGLGFELAKKFSAHGSFDSQHDCVFLKKGQKSQVIDVIREIYDV